MIRKRFGAQINPTLINQMYRASISDISWRNLGVFQEHMYHETLKTIPDIPTEITEIPNFSTTAGQGIYALLTTPGNKYYKSINRIIGNKPKDCGIIATI
ncbi:MAG TPA: hypothetical protein PK957_04040 [Candidatus Dojkabacteria bacterium]|nr:hypothetical protein [Candidatus Dojkabacteria bacterium]HQF36236.1 hypothetical protein [Candidatus Dojkabacteria bacterium]